MNIILYNAVSLDGFIATLEGDSDWVSDLDAEIFEKNVTGYGNDVLLLFHNT